MKVLITASTLPRWRDDSIPAFVLEQALALRAAHPDLEIHLLAPHHAGAARVEEQDGVTVHRFRYFWPEGLQQLVYPAILPNLRQQPWLWLQVPFLFVAEFFAILRFGWRERPDVIYSHWFAPQGLTGGVVALLLGIPHVLTSHSSDVAVMRRLPVLGAMLVRFFVGRARACTVVSRRTAGKLRAFFPDAAHWARVAGRVAVLPMGVHLAAAPPLGAAQRAALKLQLGCADRFVFLFLGRLTEKKGIALLLRAFAEQMVATGVAPTGGTSHPVGGAQAPTGLLLVIAGEGELRGAIERDIEALGLGNCVRMPGFVTGERKRDWLQAADALVVPSIVTADLDAEGLPVSLLEGLAAGKLCIATEISGADDVLTDGRDGWLVPAGDVAALATAMRRAVALPEAQREAIAVQARERAQAFDWATVAEAHYRHLLVPRPAGGAQAPTGSVVATGVAPTGGTPRPAGGAQAPTVSIVLPVYNGAKTIAETIASVLAQSFADFELIVIDDGSTDGTTGIVARFADQRIQLHSYGNAGLAASRNRGITRARGEFVAFIDADDLWRPDKLARQVRSLREHPQAALAYSFTDCINERGEFLGHGNHLAADGMVYERLLAGNFLDNGSTALVRASALAEERFDESLAAAEDWDLWLRLALRQPFACVPEADVLYRVHGGAMSSNIRRQEAACRLVLERAVERLPPSPGREALRRQGSANLYRYLAGRALGTAYGPGDGPLAARYWWGFVTTTPELARHWRPTATQLARIVIVSVLPRATARALLTRIERLAGRGRPAP